MNRPPVIRRDEQHFSCRYALAYLIYLPILIMEHLLREWMLMRFASHVVRFDMRGIPVVGNAASGALVGLTSEGVELCDAMLEREVAWDEVSIECEELVSHLVRHGFTEEAGVGECAQLGSAYLHVSNTCNLSCAGCYSIDCNRNRSVDPSFGDLWHAVDALANLGVTRLVISGGEPFLRKDLLDITRCAREQGMANITVLTNGTHCDDEALAKLAGSVDVISVSFDGASKESPSYIRGEQLFDTLVDAVKRIQAAGIHAHMLPTLHARNIQDVPAYVELSKQLGCTVGFSLLSGARADLGDLMPGDSCLAGLANVMIDVANKGDAASIDDAFNPMRALSVRICCSAGKNSVSVASDGTVYPCHMLHRPEFALGNAFTDDASEIASNLSRFTLPSVDEIEGCSLCENRYFCGGGCRARAYDEHSCMTKRDPYCAYYSDAIGQTVKAFVSQIQR